MRRPASALAAAFLVAFAVLATLVTAAASIAPGAGATSLYPVYHGNPTHTGNDTSEPALLPSHTAWAAGLDGAVYGQPLVYAGRVIAATENDTVYALDAHDGHILWRVHLGSPLTSVNAQAGCGNIDPLGITSTPVIDIARHEVFVVAEIADAHLVVHHQLFGLDVYRGTEIVSANADPGGGQNPLNIQQRAGLAIGNGRVYVGYGGLAGDCGPYHGWLVSLTESGGAKLAFDVTPHTGLGAIWAPPGPVVDPAGHVYVATGNPNADPATHDYGESVLELDGTLHLLANFSGSNASGDQDLGSVSPALLPNNLLFQVGKQNVGYLLDSRPLAELHQLPVCADEARGGTAFDGSRVYVQCSSHVQAVDMHVAARTMSLGWSGPPVSIAGPPVVADGSVWSVDYGSGRLYALDRSNGAVRANIPIGGVPHFASPTTALGLVLVGTDGGVLALAGPSGPPPPAPPPPRLASCVQQPNHHGYWMAARDGGVFAFGGAPYCGSLGNTVLNQPVVGMAGMRGPGYWLVASDGGVFTFGRARFHGSTGAMHLNQPIVGMAVTPSQNGYWLVARDGGIFSFGDAKFFGSTGAMHLNRPILGMAVTPTGNGYWLFASDGGIFAFGDARFFGSTGAMHLNAPIVGMAARGSGRGYWLVASDGGIFTFGDAPFLGSTGAMHLNAPIVGMAARGSGRGYWLVASDGGLFTFDAPFEGSLGGVVLQQPVLAIVHD